MSVFLRAKFEFSIMILRSFRQGVGGRGGLVIYPPPRPQNEPLRSPPRLGLRRIRPRRPLK